MKRVAAILALSLAIISLQTVAINAAVSKLTMTLKQTPGGAEPIVTLYGSLKPAKSGIKVSVQIQLNGKWQDTRFTTKTAKVGTWQVTDSTKWKMARYSLYNKDCQGRNLASDCCCNGARCQS